LLRRESGEGGVLCRPSQPTIRQAVPQSQSFTNLGLITRRFSQAAAKRGKEFQLSKHHLPHVIHGAWHDKKSPRFSGVILIVIGLFLTPWLIGIPILLMGIYKLTAAEPQDEELEDEE
jgi:hypothetical protein